MIARLLAIVALFLGVTLAQASMAAAPAAIAHTAAHVSADAMDDMADCHAPAKQPACQIDCALCHALAPALAPAGYVSVSYAAFPPAVLSPWETRAIEVEPPIPRIPS
ncbi:MULTISPECIES: hypothetical protein [Phenylobacterium]|uniref:Membrane protein n=1 Tax=Phenylobacterium koreense TaxID=266125 RepID=A0ABV2EDV3_9CAUL